MKKLFWLLLVTVMLSACGGSNNSAATSMYQTLAAHKAAAKATVNKASVSAPTYAQQLSIIMIFQGMFNASPGADLQKLCEELITSYGWTEPMIATVLVDVLDAFYPKGLSSKDFSNRFLDSFVGSKINAATKTILASQLTAMLDSGTNRGEAMWRIASVLSATSTSEPNLGAAAAQLNNRLFVSYYHSVTKAVPAVSFDLTANVTNDYATVTAAIASISSSSTSLPSPTNLAYTIESGNTLYLTGTYQGTDFKTLYVPGSGKYTMLTGSSGNRVRLTFSTSSGLQELYALDEGTRITATIVGQERVEYRLYSAGTKFVSGTVIYTQNGGRYYQGDLQTESFSNYSALRNVTDVTVIYGTTLVALHRMIPRFNLPRWELVATAFASDSLQDLVNSMKSDYQNASSFVQAKVLKTGYTLTSLIDKAAKIAGLTSSAPVSAIVAGAMLGTEAYERWGNALHSTTTSASTAAFNQAEYDLTRTSYPDPSPYKPVGSSGGGTSDPYRFYYPTVTSVSPSIATLNQETRFTVTGTNLKYGNLGFYLDSCAYITELQLSDSTTERVFSCLPTKAGRLNGTVTNYISTTGGVLKTFSVDVTGSSVLPAPTNVKATKTDTMGWRLTWDPVAGANEYYVFMKSGSAPAAPIGRVEFSSISFIDNQLGNTSTSSTGTVDAKGTYYWVVVAAQYDTSNYDYSTLGKASSAVSLTYSTTAPVQSTITWKITDKCLDGYWIDYRFFDKKTGEIWPSSSSNYYNNYENTTYTHTLTCTKGDQICFGGSTGSSYWGVGLNGTSGCTDCCGSCEGGTYTYNPSCSSGGTGGGGASDCGGDTRLLGTWKGGNSSYYQIISFDGCTKTLTTSQGCKASYKYFANNGTITETVLSVQNGTNCTMPNPVGTKTTSSYTIYGNELSFNGKSPYFKQ